MIVRTFRYALAILFAVFLVGCTASGEPGWKEKELKRKTKVQSLVKQLSQGSIGDRQAAYAELLDTYVQKRDVFELTKKIDLMDSPEAKQSIKELISFIDERWRLPDSKGWTHDFTEASRFYSEEFEDLGHLAIILQTYGDPTSVITELEILDSPADAKTRSEADVIDLILTLEPESLRLWQSWEDISFIGLLSNLEELTLTYTSVKDLTTLQELPELNQLNLVDAPVTDLRALKGMTSLKKLHLENVPVTNLTPLQKLPQLRELYLNNTKVTDLTPLKVLPSLERLYIENIEGFDLTPLEGSSVVISKPEK